MELGDGLDGAGAVALFKFEFRPFHFFVFTFTLSSPSHALGGFFFLVSVLCI